MLRRTVNNEPLYRPAGTSYVYMTYGMYYCLNVSAAEPGAAVLLRALEPIEGVEYMRSLRSGNYLKNTIFYNCNNTIGLHSKKNVKLKATKAL